MRELSAKLTEGEIIPIHFLSPSQKSKIFASPLVRGGLGCGGLLLFDKLEFGGDAPAGDSCLVQCVSLLP